MNDAPVISRSAAQGSKTEAIPLNSEDPLLNDDIREVVRSASHRWLKNPEVLLVLERFQGVPANWPAQPAVRPDGAEISLLFLLLLPSLLPCY